MKGNLVIGQSGGPTAVINASVAGIVSGAVKQGFDGEILGMVNGIEGLLNENFLDLKRFSDKDEKEALIDTPSAYLGSCRFKMPKPEEDPGIYEKIFNIIKKRNIRYFLYIGGNDSMDTVYRLSEYARGRDWEMSIVGVPKSIDNDLAGTDHCPGYGSAAKFIASSIREMAIDTGVYNLKSVLIVEIMGRNAGWLTASAALARNENFSAPDLIYLPEADFAPDKFLSDVEGKLREKNTVIVAVSEGIRSSDGKYICDSVASGAVDNFGHKYLSGAGKVLENMVRERLGVKARAVELNVLQRCAGHLKSERDVTEALKNGEDAFNAAYSGVTGMMIGLERISDEPYEIKNTPADIKNSANAEKKIPKEWITPGGNDVTEEFLRYARPLIEGEHHPKFSGGLPVYITRG